MRNRNRQLIIPLGVLFTILLAVAPRTAQADDNRSALLAADAQDLNHMNLEDLMNVEVASVSKQKQKASEAPAAITVITQDDIARSHFDSIPELLRLAPGLTVSQLNADTWVIGSRGFNDVYANKLQVLMDGRSVYTPLFSGVFWEMQESLVADLDRIEVIRGPGATLWGANAVNGVINISSKSAFDTQGFLFDGRYGEFNQRGSMRYGGKIGDDTYYRVWGQYRNNDNFPLPFPGGDGHDGWDALVGGFRIDKFATTEDKFTLIGNAGAFREGTALFPQFIPPFSQPRSSTFNAHGDNLTARWTHQISDKSDFTLQAYYDHVDRIVAGPYTLDTGDIDFQHRFPLGQRQEVIWGLGYRFTADQATGLTGLETFDPIRRDDYIASAFVQDDITVLKDRLHLILGTKLEENSYSGFEVQPSARVLWTPSPRQSIWGAVSRAVRTPSRFEQDGTIKISDVTLPPTNMPAQSFIDPNRSFESEQLMAYELGYRLQATKSLSFDTAAFYNHYSHLRSFDQTMPFFDPNVTPPGIVVPLRVDNKIAANSYGLEFAANWNVTDRWRLAGSYSLIRVDAHDVGSANDFATVPFLENVTPRNQAQLHSYFDLTKNLQFDASVYYREKLAQFNVPSNFRVDLALTWTPKPNLDVTLGVQNLLDPKNPEFGMLDTNIAATQVPRMAFIQLKYRF